MGHGRAARAQRLAQQPARRSKCAKPRAAALRHEDALGSRVHGCSALRQLPTQSSQVLALSPNAGPRPPPRRPPPPPAARRVASTEFAFLEILWKPSPAPCPRARGPRRCFLCCSKLLRPARSVLEDNISIWHRGTYISIFRCETAVVFRLSAVRQHSPPLNLHHQHIVLLVFIP